MVFNSRFNPTLVRLRLRPMAFVWLAIAVFQSHAGSIEVIGLRHWMWEQKGFQSHAGSIEVCHGMAPVGNLVPRFNPTLVRLRSGGGGRGRGRG